MLKYIIDTLWAICHPRYWLMNNPYSGEWERQLTMLMEEYKFKNIGNHTATIGSVEVWITNFPYAAFSPYRPVELNVRPSRRMIKKAHARLVRDAFSKEG